MAEMEERESEHNMLVKCPVCGAQLSIEPAEDAAEEHANEAKQEAAPLRDTIKQAMEK
jgi:peptide subunit release factor 1 (eRF1)